MFKCFVQFGVYVKQFVANLLSRIPQLTPANITTFVNNLIDGNLNMQQYTGMIRDFLIALKEFSSDDNSELYADEADAEKQRNLQRLQAVPGMIGPNQ